MIPSERDGHPGPLAGRVAVIVVLYDCAPLLPALVTSLHEGMSGLSWELVAVDNASSDDSVATVRALAPSATVVQLHHNAGYAAGINAGVAAAGAHAAVLVLNPDVRLRPGAARELLGRLRAPGVGIAVPRLEDGQGRLIYSLRREPSLMRAWADAVLGGHRAGRFATLGEVVTDLRSYDAERLTDWAEGSTQMIDATCWSVCGGWDESFFLYSEETEYNLRARDAGFATVYVPSARAVHLEGGSGGSSALRALLLVNRVRLFARRNGRIRGGSFWMATVTREAIRAARGDVESRTALRALLSLRRLRGRPGPEWVAALATTGGGGARYQAKWS